MERDCYVCLLQVRLQSQSSVLSGTEKYTLDQFAVSDVKSVLRDQQQAIQVEFILFDQDPGISPPPGNSFDALGSKSWTIK